MMYYTILRILYCGIYPKWISEVEPFVSNSSMDLTKVLCKTYCESSENVNRQQL